MFNLKGVPHFYDSKNNSNTTPQVPQLCELFQVPYFQHQTTGKHSSQLVAKSGESSNKQFIWNLHLSAKHEYNFKEMMWLLKNMLLQV